MGFEAGRGSSPVGGGKAERWRMQPDDGRVRTQSVIVTAGTGGLGRAVAEALLREGYAVTATFRSDEGGAARFRTAMAEHAARLQVVRADAADRSAAAESVRLHRERFGVEWALVHAAGPFVFGRARLSDQDPADVDAMIDGNLRSTVWYLQEVLPGMRRAGGGRVVVFGFDHADRLPGWPGRAAYAAAKSGVLSLSATLAQEEAPNRITVNAVCPGDIRPEYKERRISDARGKPPDGAPVGRPGTGEDIARVIAFLLAEDSDFLTGNTIYVGGGLDVLHAPRH